MFLPQVKLLLLPKNVYLVLPTVTLIWVGFLRVRFEMGGGGVKLTPAPHRLKHARIMLDSLNFARK